MTEKMVQYRTGTPKTLKWDEVEQFVACNNMRPGGISKGCSIGMIALRPDYLPR